MQLKNKIIHITGVFLVLLGIAGGSSLWLMQNKTTQTILEQAEQNESALYHFGRIQFEGLKMIESVGYIARIGQEEDGWPIEGVPEVEEMLTQFTNSYALLVQELRILAGEKGEMVCDAFLIEIEEDSEGLYEAGMQVFGANDDMRFDAALVEFSAAENDFLDELEKGPVKQSSLFETQVDTAQKHFILFFRIFWIGWLVISVIAVVTMNRLCNDITKRVRAMNKMVETVGAGQFSIRVQDEEPDELGELARKMNLTTSYLAETRQNLERMTRELSVQLEEKREIEARLAVAATHDSLTGLPNRASFFEQFNHAIALADRQRENMALLFADMDGLKIVNDAFGHDGGDMLIQQVGERLQRNIRKSDYVARLAGDEFVVILEDLQHVDDDVSMVCTKLLMALAEPYEIRGRRIKLTASIGVSLFPGHGRTAAELLHKADSAMYQVKNSGKNNFSVYGARQIDKI